MDAFFICLFFLWVLDFDFWYYYWIIFLLNEIFFVFFVIK